MFCFCSLGGWHANQYPLVSFKAGEALQTCNLALSKATHAAFYVDAQNFVSGMELARGLERNDGLPARTLVVSQDEEFSS